MAVAFLFIAAGSAYAAGLQQLIYSRGPCYRFPLECTVASFNEGDADIHTNPTSPNEVSVWLQTPLHFLLAIGEILGLLSLNEYTYTEAPTNIKSVVQVLQGLAAAAAAPGIGLGPVSENPWLFIMLGMQVLAGPWLFLQYSFGLFSRNTMPFMSNEMLKALGRLL